MKSPDFQIIQEDKKRSRIRNPSCIPSPHFDFESSPSTPPCSVFPQPPILQYHTLNNNRRKIFQMGQHDSLLFRLPRELRDDVYRYYVTDIDGYHYDPEHDSLRTVSGDKIDLALCYTCKRVAGEMTGLALQLNKITFRTVPSHPCPINRYSDVAVFEHLISEHVDALTHMLSWARTLVTPTILAELILRYPENTNLKIEAELNDEDRNASLRRGVLPEAYAVEYIGNYTQQQDVIQLIAAHPDFKTLTAKEYLPHLRDVWTPDYAQEDDDDSTLEDIKKFVCKYNPPVYDEDSQQEIMAWKPEPWVIPSSTDLKRVTKFLPINKRVITYDGSKKHWRKGSYFSAAAGTIRFLQRLPPNVRLHLRRIVIQEDHASGPLPMSHAQGLIPFCRENHSLSVERRVDICQVLLLEESSAYGGSDTVLEEILTWIKEVELLYRKGMPANSFELVLHGHSPRASQQLLDGMTRAAILQEAIVEAARRDGAEYWISRYNVLDLPETIKQVLKGNLTTRFDTATAELWDLEEVLRQHHGEWPEKFEPAFSVRRDIDEPIESWDRGRLAEDEEDEEEVDWADRLDGWDMLTTTV